MQSLFSSRADLSINPCLMRDTWFRLPFMFAFFMEAGFTSKTEMLIKCEQNQVWKEAQLPQNLKKDQQKMLDSLILKELKFSEEEKVSIHYTSLILDIFVVIFGLKDIFEVSNQKPLFSYWNQISLLQKILKIKCNLSKFFDCQLFSIW